MDLVSDIVNTGTVLNLAKENLFGLFTNLTVLNMLVMTLMKDKQFPKTKKSFKKEYDYIIIGGGTAGAVIANRLSEKPCVNVLLLEAGGEGLFLTDIPSYARLFYRTGIDWEYKTTPQKYGGFGQIGNRVLWNSGKLLGGGSVLNAMLYVRGNLKNYDDWEREGCTGWGYKGVLPYFKKLEDNKNIEELDPGYHGTGGPMTMEKPKYTPEIKHPVLRAMQNMGYELTDSNGERQRGIFDLQATMRNGQRCSTAKAYLVPAENRPNLDILKNAFARKILIKNKTANGVEFDFGGKTHRAYARKEVVVSSGSVRTAQILMLSGIGPRKHLERFGIPVVVNLPVGQNLQDHPDVYMTYTVNSAIAPVILKNFNPLNILKYIANRSGPLAAPTQCTLLAFVDGENATSPECDFPLIELYFAEYTALDAKLNYNLKPEVFQKVYKPHLGKPSYVCIVSHLQPKSRGHIKLKSLDPYDHPIINPNYFKVESDVRDMVAGMKLCNRIAKSPEMQKVQAKPYETVFPGCEGFVGNENRLLNCQARSVILSAWHPVGTARMGQPNDPRSVVDPKLKVIGVDRLRIVNAAVMPIIPSANTNVPTMMVAEKAYDIMKGDIKCGKDVQKGGRRRSCRQRNKGLLLF